MPEMDGFMLMEQIRERRISAAGAVVMLTSTGQRGDAARCAELGIAAHLTKPAGLSQLMEAMQKALADAPAPASEITDQRMCEDQTGLRILLAEDNVVNQKLAMRLLQRHGHAVTVVDNGRAALNAVERELFDVVLMDVQMPEMDGFEATGAIRQSENGTGRHLPVVAMTAHAMSGDRERCLDAGMDGYVSKPVRPQELLAEISRVRAALLDGGVEPALIAAIR
jgi:two-component system sensor histidine kinase/response regulator